MLKMAATTTKTTSSGVTMVIEMIRVGPLQNQEIAPRDGGGSLERVEDML